MVFKKHLSRIGGRRGKVVKQKGKGASDFESDPMNQTTGNYGKPEPVDDPVAPPARPVMPGIGGGMPTSPYDEDV